MFRDLTSCCVGLITIRFSGKPGDEDPPRHHANFNNLDDVSVPESPYVQNYEKFVVKILSWDAIGK